jgi:hypothetical protein
VPQAVGPRPALRSVKPKALPFERGSHAECAHIIVRTRHDLHGYRQPIDAQTAWHGNNWQASDHVERVEQ